MGLKNWLRKINSALAFLVVGVFLSSPAFSEKRGPWLHKEALLKETKEVQGIPTAVQGIRQKLEVDPSNPQFILTVRGVGYKFEDEPL